MLTSIANMVLQAGPTQSVSMKEQLKTPADRYVYCRTTVGVEDPVLCRGYATGSINDNIIQAAALQQVKQLVRGAEAEVAAEERTIARESGTTPLPAKEDVLGVRLMQHQSRRFAAAVDIPGVSSPILQDVQTAKTLVGSAGTEAVAPVAADAQEMTIQRTTVMIDEQGMRIRAQFVDGSQAFLQGKDYERYAAIAKGLLESTAAYLDMYPIQRHDGQVIFRANAHNEVADYNMLSHDSNIPQVMRDSTLEVVDSWSYFKHVCANEKAVTINYESGRDTSPDMMVIAYRAYLPTDAASWKSVVFQR